MALFGQGRVAALERRFIGRAGVLGILAPLFLTTAAQAQGELRGRVVAENGTPVPGAVITLTAIRYSVRADTLGRFVLTGTAGGTLELSIAAAGFRDEAVSVVLGRGGPVNRDFVLTGDDTPLPVETTRFLRGAVTDLEGTPLAFANVQLNGGRRYLANDSGHFAIPLTTSGRLTLLSRRIGFEASELVLDAAIDTPVTLRMKQIAQVLAEQVVTTRSPFVSLDLHGFYRRMADAERGVNSGYFITPEDLELRKPLMVTNAVEHLPSIRVRPGNAEITKSVVNGDTIRRGVTSARNLRVEDRSGCPMTVFLDGIRVSPLLSHVRNVPAGSFGIKDLADEQINTLISPVAIAGIEVYTREATTPPQFQAIAGTCGAVVIWSK